MPRVYVGTYAKYNSGSIAGDWLDLEDYSDKGEFHEACKALHPDESDPEFMFQDWEEIPKGYISESHIDDNVWEWLKLDDREREIVEAYREHVREDADQSDILDNFRGEYKNRGDMAYEYHTESGEFDENSPLSNYINWDHVGRDMLMDGMDSAELSHDRLMVWWSF